MDLELIVAFNNKNVIGMNNKIPWHVPKDLKNFKKLTDNNIIVMGRKTFESLPNGKLKNRIHIIITTKPEIYENSESIYYINYEESLKLIINIKEKTGKKVFIIGGRKIYDLFFDICTKFHVTQIDDESDGDVYFPHNLEYFNKNFIKKLEETYVSYEKNDYKFCKDLSNSNPDFVYYLFGRKNSSTC